RLVGPQAVARLALAAGPADSAAVDLAAEAELLRVGADLCAEPLAVLGHVVGIVARQPAEVERVERRRADAAEPRREGGDVRPRGVPAKERQLSHRSAPVPPPARTRGRRALRAASGGEARRAPPPRAATQPARARRDRCR